jgi:hypothetical protein
MTLYRNCPVSCELLLAGGVPRNTDNTHQITSKLSITIINFSKRVRILTAIQNLQTCSRSTTSSFVCMRLLPMPVCGVYEVNPLTRMLCSQSPSLTQIEPESDHKHHELHSTKSKSPLELRYYSATGITHSLTVLHFTLFMLCTSSLQAETSTSLSQCQSPLQFTHTTTASSKDHNLVACSRVL